MENKFKEIKTNYITGEIVDEEKQKELEQAFKDGKLEKVGEIKMERPNSDMYVDVEKHEWVYESDRMVMK